MPGVLYRYLSADHERLEALLNHAVANPDEIDMEPYSEFRKGLLRHISMEEKIILPAIAKWQGGRKAANAERLRLDHGAIVSLLVPPPRLSIIRTLRSIFAVHNALEENEGGLYRVFETLGVAETDTMMARLNAAPAVLVLPHNEKSDALDVTKRAVARAGYQFID
jgi:hypothetical protein